MAAACRTACIVTSSGDFRFELNTSGRVVRVYFPGTGYGLSRATCAVPNDWQDRLEEVLAGEKTFLDLPWDADFIKSGFQRDCLLATREIPPGNVISYSELALRVRGDRRYARAVGRAMAGNPLPLFFPCHRIVGKGHTLGGFSCGLTWKLRLLSAEQVHLV